MCELFALNFNRPVRPSLSFRGFRHRGEKNPDGWGVARFEGSACQVLKEPVRAYSSALSDFLADYEAFESNTVIGHVRLASKGDNTLANTHPFQRTFRSRDIVFAHNGTVKGLETRDKLKFRPVGDTDSEHLFCALLTQLSREPIDLTDFQKIEHALQSFNENGRMNVLFADSERLYCYRDNREHNGLYILERDSPFDRITLKDEDWEVNLAEEKNREQRGFVIASEPLTDESWQEISAGTLTVLQNGQYIYGAG